MPFAVEMYFDKVTEKKVQGVWSDLAEANISSYMLDSGDRPHVSLGVFGGCKTPEFESELARFVKEIHPFSLELSSIGIFPTSEGVVYYGVVVTERLLEMHRNFYERFANLVTASSAYYHPGNWVPHCTLAIQLASASIPAAIEVCSKQALPITGKVQQIGLIEFPKHREVVMYGIKDE